MPEDQIEIALSHFFGSGGAPAITSEDDYSAAKTDLGKGP